MAIVRFNCFSFSIKQYCHNPKKLPSKVSSAQGLKCFHYILQAIVLNGAKKELEAGLKENMELVVCHKVFESMVDELCNSLMHQLQCSNDAVLKAVTPVKLIKRAKKGVAAQDRTRIKPATSFTRSSTATALPRPLVVKPISSGPVSSPRVLLDREVVVVLKPLTKVAELKVRSWL